MAQHTVDQGFVPLQAVADKIGGMGLADAKRVVEREGVAVLEDWAGDWVISAADARRLRVEYERARAERDRRERAYEAWKERRKKEHFEKLAAAERERRAEEERRLQRAREEERAEMAARYAQQAAIRAAERAKYEPDLSRAAFEREGGR